MHSAMEYQKSRDMSVILKDGSVAQMSAPPPGLAQCGNFDWDEEEFISLSKHPRSPCE